MARVRSPRLIGRDADLARLEAALDAVRESGRSRVVVVLGEAGIGKTRLVEELSVRAARASITTRVGACLDVGGGVPFAPWLEILRRGSGPGTGGPDLVGALQLIRPALDGSTSENPVIGQSRLFGAFLDRIQAWVAGQPSILVIEDLHWADRGTLELTAFLAWNLRDDPLLVVLTARDDEARDPLADDLLHEVLRQATTDRLELRRLDVGEVAEQLASIAGHAVDAAVSVSVHARSGGNPYLAEELAALSIDGDIAGLPPTPRDIVLARLAGLPLPAQRVAEAAAVGGPRVDPERLLTVVDEGVGDVRTAVDSLLDAALLVRVRDADRPERLEFRHALTREAIEGDLLVPERRAWHARWAAALESDTGQLDHAAIADHRRSSGRPDLALPHDLLVARLAYTESAFATSADAFDRILDDLDAGHDVGLDPRPDRAEILRSAADANRYAGRAARSVELMTELLALLPEADHRARATAHERLGTYRTDAGDHAGAMTETARALELLGDGDPVDRARLLVSHVITLVDNVRFDGVLDLAREASVLAHDHDLVAIEALARCQIGVATALLGDAATAGPEMDRAWDLALGCGDPEAILLVALDRPVVDGIRGDFDAAAERGAEGVAAIERIGAIGAFDALGLVTNLAADLTLLGRWAEADHWLGRADAVDPLGRLRHETILLRARLASWRGDPATAAAELSRPHVPVGPQIDCYDAIIAGDAARLAGHPLDGLSAAESAMTEVAPVGNLTGLLQRLEVAALAVSSALDVRDRGDPAASADAAARALALADASATAWGELAGRRDVAEARGWQAVIDAGRADLADDPAAVDAWRVAAETWRGMRLRYAEGWAWHRLAAAALRHRAPRAIASEAARRAHAVAVDLGAAPLREEVEALARRSRLGPLSDVPERPTTSRSGLGLTDRERQVLALIADGQTNRQIAEALFISPKTASVHVSNVLGKLGVGGRVEAAMTAVRDGLLEEMNTRAERN
jgi:DNA-binding CsgD family transcriptional regulator